MGSANSRYSARGCIERRAPSAVQLLNCSGVEVIRSVENRTTGRMRGYQSTLIVARLVIGPKS